jgi:pimeloyl-ACP methyl ester carboxylesterase
MADRYKVRYARSGDVSIAYQVVGGAPIDLVMVPGLASHLDMDWEDPAFAQCMQRLTSFCRVIRFDKRGTGLSDRDVGGCTLDDRMDDLRAVMDAVGSREAAVMGWSEGGGLALLFAASHPERVRALILSACYPRSSAAQDYPEGEQAAQAFDRLEHYARTAWGSGGLIDFIYPAAKDTPAARELIARYERAAQSPRSILVHLAWAREIDVRPVARALTVPTLVLHRTGDRMVPVSGSRWLARNIPGARFVEQPGDEHLLEHGDPTAFLDEIERFLTGSTSSADAERVLATVLFTDIANSTATLAESGDRRWRNLLQQHHAVVRDQLARFRGREIDCSGDGFFATFDGPARAIRCALAIRDAVRLLGIDVRVGVHTGECERSGDKVAGIAVHIGARVMDRAKPGEILVSSTVKDLVAGSGIAFQDHGVHSLKGVPDSWHLFRVA